MLIVLINTNIIMTTQMASTLECLSTLVLLLSLISVWCCILKNLFIISLSCCALNKQATSQNQQVSIFNLRRLIKLQARVFKPTKWIRKLLIFVNDKAFNKWHNLIILLELSQIERA